MMMTIMTGSTTTTIRRIDVIALVEVLTVRNGNHHPNQKRKIRKARRSQRDHMEYHQLRSIVTKSTMLAQRPLQTRTIFGKKNSINLLQIKYYFKKSKIIDHNWNDNVKSSKRKPVSNDGRSNKWRWIIYIT